MNVKMRLSLLLFCLWAVHADQGSLDVPVVRTMAGLVKGTTMHSRSGKSFYAYLGVPYAQPPVGGLRFETPKTVEKWDGVRDATVEGSRCPQLSVPERKYEGHEDCLYANIFTPEVPENTDTESLMEMAKDVVVLIHGGGFTYGAGDLAKHSPDHIMDHDIVLVTFNYRLGPLGFLATGDPLLAGNYGLKDQSLLLRWVKRNIPFFGGNPHSVTLLGYQAGGASAHYHMFPALSFRTFHGVISISGTALSPWAHVATAEAKSRAFRLGELVGCRKDQLKDSKALKACLLKKPAEDLVRKAAKVMDWGTDLSMPFVPVTEPFMPRNRTMVPHNAERMIESLGRLVATEQVPWVIGSASHEGLPYAMFMLVFRKMMGQMNEDPALYVPKFLGMAVPGGEEKAREYGQRIWDQYMGEEVLNKATIGRIVDMASDYYTFYGINKAVELHTEFTAMPMFVYHYAWKKNKSPIVLGVPPGHEIQLMFPDIIGGKKINYTEVEYGYAEKLLKMVVNFAGEGRPAADGVPGTDGLEWPEAEYGNFSYLLVDDEWSIQQGGLYRDRVQFWEDIIGEIRAETVAADKELRDRQERAWHEQEAAKEQQDQKEETPTKKSDRFVKLEL